MAIGASKCPPLRRCRLRRILGYFNPHSVSNHIQLLRAAGALLDAWELTDLLKTTYRVLSAAQAEGVAEGGCVVGGGGGFVDHYNGLLVQVWVLLSRFDFFFCWSFQKYERAGLVCWCSIVIRCLLSAAQIAAFLAFALVVMPLVAWAGRNACAKCCTCAKGFSRGRIIGAPFLC